VVFDLPIEMHYGGEKLGQNREGVIGFLPFLGPNFCAKFHQNRTKIASVGVGTGRQTD